MAQYLQLTLVSKLLASPAYTYSVVKALPSPMQMIGFFTNLVVPITIDKHPEWYHPPQISSSPLLNNVLLLLLFTIPHRYSEVHVLYIHLELSKLEIDEQKLWHTCLCCWSHFVEFVCLNTDTSYNKMTKK